MEAALVAAIVAGTALLGQWLLKRQDFARQDQVAARAAEAATLLLAANERVARTTNETNGKLSEANDKLDQVHRIVNQQRTDMQRYQAVLQEALRRAGVDIPPDESLK